MEWINDILNSNGCSEDIFRLLVDRGGGNVADAHGYTALMQASRAGYLEIVKLLLDRGAVIDSVDKGGNKAFIKAAAGCHVEIVKIGRAHV